MMMPAALRAIIPKSFWPSLRPASCEPARQLVVLRHPCLATGVRGGGDAAGGAPRNAMFSQLPRRDRASVVVLRHPCLATGVRVFAALCA